MNETAHERMPKEQKLVELGGRLRDLLPSLIAQWEQALNDLLQKEAVPTRKGLRGESLSAAHKLIQAMAEGQPSKGRQEGGLYGEAMARQGLSYVFLGEWLTVLRQSLLAGLMHVYTDDRELDQAIIIFAQFFSSYTLQATTSFSSRQQGLLLEQQEALRRTYEEAQRRVVELEVLNEIGQALSSTIELDDLLELIYQQTSRLMDTTYFYIALCDWKQGLLYFEIDQEEGERRPRNSIDIGKGLTGYVAQTGQALFLPRGPDAFLKEQGIARVGRPSTCWLGVPMVIQERVIGVIVVQNYEHEEVYDEGHLRILSTIASQAAAALENARLYQEARQRAEEMEAFYRIGMTSVSQLSLEAIFQAVYEQAGLVMDTSAFFVALYDEEQDEISFQLIYDKGEPVEAFRLIKSEQGGLTGWVLDHGETLLIKNWERDAKSELGDLAVKMGDAVASWLGVPMIVRGQTIGVIAAQSYETEAFDEHHQKMLEMIAHYAAAAAENARLYQEAHQRVEELSAMQKISLNLAATTDQDKALDAVADSAMELLHPSDVVIFLYDASRQVFTLGTGVRATGERGLFVPMPRPDGMTATVAHTGEMLIIENVPKHDLYAQAPEQALNLYSLVGIPLIRSGEVFGVLNVAYYEHHRFTKSELRLLQSFADQAAVAVANAHLFQRIQSMMQELQETAEAQSQLLHLVQEMSTPVVPLLEGVLLMPLVGSIDSMRGRQILDRLLQMVEQQQSRVVLVDITGVPIVDTSVAQILLHAVSAVRLLGGEVVLVGITPEVAQTLVSLGVDLGGIVTRSDLQGGVAYARRKIGGKLKQKPAVGTPMGRQRF